MQSNDLAKGGRVAQKSFFVLVAVGIVEVFVGVFSLSIALIADGIQSFADAVVSLIVWVGLRFSRKAPDGRFHFGYYRVETFSSIVAAFVMSGLGAIILYEAYLGLLNPEEIVNAEVAIVVALGATGIASILLIYKLRAARNYSSTALKTDALNSVKDVLTSATAFVSIVINRYLRVLQVDSIGAIIISLFIFTVAYSVIRESSLVLMDACECGEIVSDIEKVAKSVMHVKRVHSVRVRKLGPYLIGDMHVEVDSELRVREAHQIASEIEEKVKQEFDEVTEIKVRIEPYTSGTQQAKEAKETKG